MITASDIAEIEVLNNATVTAVVNEISNAMVSRLIVTDH